MNERLLQFIWQFQYFNRTSLATTGEKSLQILHPGILNKNAGPDFSEAKIKIDNTTWVGNIELHIKSSDWLQHKHSADKNYNNIILHVVWLHDKEIKDANDNNIPTLELQSCVPKIMLQKFERLMSANDFIPCCFSLPVLNEVGWLAWKERLIIERLEKKSELITNKLRQVNNNWEETFWQMLARGFGMKVNADAFEEMAKSLSVNILAKHKNQIHQLEALLLGQAGLLQSNFEDSYAVMLQKEYQFLSKKYLLNPINKKPDFLRMRPNNFPTIRLAQLAMLIHQSSHLFSKIKTAKSTNEIFQWFDVTANDFWNYHYTLIDEQVFQPKQTGKTFIQHIIINTIVPVLFAYGFVRNEHIWKDKAVNFLMQLQSEQNIITKQWKNFNIENKNAFDSQALIHLKNNYCNYKKCLDCAVGAKLLKD
jgi:hypothetical protein